MVNSKEEKICWGDEAIGCCNWQALPESNTCSFHSPGLCEADVFMTHRQENWETNSKRNSSASSKSLNWAWSISCLNLKIGGCFVANCQHIKFNSSFCNLYIYISVLTTTSPAQFKKCTVVTNWKRRKMCDNKSFCQRHYFFCTNLTGHTRSCIQMNF